MNALAQPRITHTIHLVNNGQDFDRWDVTEDGTVVDCGPFQRWLWIGCRVTNLAELAPGSTVQFLTAPPNARGPIPLKHLVERVEVHA